jgi:uncharacterized membrane protein YkgB
MTLLTKSVLALIVLAASIVFAIWYDNYKFAREAAEAQKHQVTINDHLIDEFRNYRIPEIPHDKPGNK